MVAKINKKGADSFQDRLARAEISQKAFEKYCKEKRLGCAPFGTDEKRAKLYGYLRIHPFLRKLCDYIVSTPEEIIFTDVKATRNIKLEDISHYSIFESLFCTENQTFVLSFYLNKTFYFATMDDVIKCSVDKKLEAYIDGPKVKPYFTLSYKDIETFNKEIHLYG